ncbi:MAG: MFS transporter [Candidatus Heimdallarchaeota archaeon]
MTNGDIFSGKKDDKKISLPIKRNLPVLVTSAFLLNGAFRITQTLQQPLILYLEGSIKVVGVVVSISTFSMLAAQAIFGEFSDAIGRRLPMLIASLLLLTASLLFLTATHWVVLIPAVLLMGFAFALNQPAAAAATAESVLERRRGRAFAYRSSGRYMAGVIVSILAYIIIQRRTLQSAFFICTIFALANLCLIFFLLKEMHFITHDFSPSSFLQNLRQIWRIPSNLKKLYFFVALLDTFAFETGWSLIYALLTEYQGITSQLIVLYALIQSLVGGLFQLGGVAGRLADWNRKWTLVLADAIGLPVILICALFPNERTILAAFVGMGFATGLFVPTLYAFVVDHVSPERTASEFGKLWGARGIVSLFPPILGGFLAATYGYSAPLLVNVFLGILNIIFLLWKF